MDVKRSDPEKKLEISLAPSQEGPQKTAGKIRSSFDLIPIFAMRPVSVLSVFPMISVAVWGKKDVSFYLQLRSFYLRFVFFIYGGGTVSKKDLTQFPDGGNCK